MLRSFKAKMPELGQDIVLLLGGFSIPGAKGIELLRGRFVEIDNGGTQNYAVVDGERVVELLGPERDPRYYLWVYVEVLWRTAKI